MNTQTFQLHSTLLSVDNFEIWRFLLFGALCWSCASNMDDGPARHRVQCRMCGRLSLLQVKQSAFIAAARCSRRSCRWPCDGTSTSTKVACVARCAVAPGRCCIVFEMSAVGHSHRNHHCLNRNQTRSARQVLNRLYRRVLRDAARLVVAHDVGGADAAYLDTAMNCCRRNTSAARQTYCNSLRRI